MAYIENTLNLTNSYYKVTSSEGDQFEYLVPFPSGYTSIMKAHWTTDGVYTRIVLMVLYYNSGIGHRKWDGAVNSGIDVRIVGLMHE